MSTSADTQIHSVERHRATAHIAGFFHAATSTWAYVVSDPVSRKAAVIDAVLDFDLPSARTATHFADHIVCYLHQQQLSIEWILETHAHADHLSAADVLSHATGGRTAIGAGIVQVQSEFARIYHLGAGFALDGSQFDRLLRDGDEIVLGALRGRVIATPGHTSDSVSYLFADAVFVGDTVFMPETGTARCDFPGGNAQQLFHSIRRLYELPDDTRVFVCHDYPAAPREPLCDASVAEHKRANLHLSAVTSEAQFVKLRSTRDATLTVPTLLIPAVQVNIRAGRRPPPEANGISYLKSPLNTLGRP